MKIVRFVGTGPGPVLEAGVLSKRYDFSANNTLPMSNPDAVMLVLRSRQSFTDVTEQVLTARKELEGLEELISAYKAAIKAEAEPTKTVKKAIKKAVKKA